MSRDKKQEAILRKVLRRIAPHWMLLAGTLLLALACVACQLYVPILVGRGVDCILGPGQVDFETLGAILLWIGLTAAAGALAQWCIENGPGLHIEEPESARQTYIDGLKAYLSAVREEVHHEG